jgi:multidrug efflux pump subunit AcrB
MALETHDADVIRQTHNTARFCVENRSITWMLLLAVVLWGAYGYINMPKLKDPDIPVRVAVAITPWPGVSAEKVEQLVTRTIEDTIAQNSTIHPPTPGDFGIKSLSLPGVSVVTVQLGENIRDTKREFNDINLRLKGITSLPSGAGPIQFQSDFGNTAALMLTIASPKASGVEVALRARTIAQAITAGRALLRPEQSGARAAIVAVYPESISPQLPLHTRDLLARYITERNFARDLRPLQGSGFVGLDLEVDADDATILGFVQAFVRERLDASGFHPDAWPAVVIREPQEAETRLALVASDKYTYRALDDFTELLQRTLLTVPQVSKVDRYGVLAEQIFLEYSQEKLASYGVQPARLQQLLSARNIALSGGIMEIEGKNLLIAPSGEFKDANEIANTLITTSSTGSPVYLRDLVDIARAYQSPPRYLNFFTWRDAQGRWQRTRAITLAVQMRAREQIGQFGAAVDQALAAVKPHLPNDLIIARTSDQPRQVKENIELFMDALYEAIVLVILVALLGFLEWRSPLLMAISIPLTLAMTYGMVYMLGVDLQQVSIATLIIALGLLVDDPVVAGDAIKRDLVLGHPSLVASWLGPTKLAKAILFATITNIVAYLPFLLLTGSTGEFLYSLPIVMTCALIASRLVSMTFIPLLGYYLLRPSRRPERSVEERRVRGFTGLYYRLGTWAIAHRWLVLVGSLACLGLGGYFVTHLKTSFFPEDLQYWAYVDIWLPNNTTLAATNKVAVQAEAVIRGVVEEYGRAHPDKHGQPRQLLKSLTTFVGGGGPRFWFSVSPELQQLNYAQLIIEVTDKEVTPHLVGVLQQALSQAVTGARLDVRQLQTNPVDTPLEVRLFGRSDLDLRQEDDIRTLRQLAGQVRDIFHSAPEIARVRDDWDDESFLVQLHIDPDRANMAGVTNLDVAMSSLSGMSGMQVATLREGNKQIPIVTRLRMDERAQLSDLQNLYVYASQSAQKVPLMGVAVLQSTLETQRIRRLEHFRTVTVKGFPAPGRLASEGLQAVWSRLQAFERTLPPGYSMQIGGEYAKQQQGFLNLVIVLAISVAAIYLALVFQFKSAVKPWLVFAAVPYGTVGALAALYVMGTPFGFMAFLGIASLVGVIVSHVIVLFDFIEERHEAGEPLIESLLDAGIARLRPVLITVGATVLALFPLALHGGPLWEPLCYAQIGGLSVATFIELLLVPVLYAIFVLDIKLVTWDTTVAQRYASSTDAGS